MMSLHNLVEAHAILTFRLYTEKINKYKLTVFRSIYYPFRGGGGMQIIQHS